MTHVQREKEKPTASITKDFSLQLTETQKEMWLAARISEGALRACNNTLLIHLRGDLKCDVLHQCLQELVDLLLWLGLLRKIHYRHVESLRNFSRCSKII